MPIARLTPINLFYEIRGEENKETIILIAGLGSQMLSWSSDFCEQLVEQGYRVIRFDNRDAGLSDFSTLKISNKEELISSLQQGIIPDGSYRLQDMAQDVIGLMDYLKIDKAHIFGRSLGGIIAQILASHYPSRVASLTLIMSTSLRPNLPQASTEVMEVMLAPTISFSENRSAYIAKRLHFIQLISGKQEVIKELEEKNIILEAERAPAAHTIAQICAMSLTTFESIRSKDIKVPTIVIHGTDDPIFPIACGQDIANVIPRAVFLPIAGMGHTIPATLYEPIIKSFMDLSLRKTDC